MSVPDQASDRGRGVGGAEGAGGGTGEESGGVGGEAEGVEEAGRKKNRR